jgi:hypothetical protein
MRGFHPGKILLRRDFRLGRWHLRYYDWGPNYQGWQLATRRAIYYSPTARGALGLLVLRRGTVTQLCHVYDK